MGMWSVYNVIESTFFFRWGMRNWIELRWLQRLYVSVYVTPIFFHFVFFFLFFLFNSHSDDGLFCVDTNGRILFRWGIWKGHYLYTIRTSHIYESRLTLLFSSPVYSFIIDRCVWFWILYSFRHICTQRRKQKMIYRRLRKKNLSFFHVNQMNCNSSFCWEIRWFES